MRLSVQHIQLPLDTFPGLKTGLTADLSDQLETVQKRALRIMFGGLSFTHHSYESFCYNLETLPLSARRDQLATHFFS